MRRAAAITAIAAVLASGAVAAPSAGAFRPLLSEAFLKLTPSNPLPPPEGEIEGPCGLAVSGNGDVYVADYYHRAIDVFFSTGEYRSQISLPGGPVTGLGANELDGVCGLVIDAFGSLYANEWHEGVVRLLPTEFTLDSGESTGVAVDAAGDVFVDDRTYVAEYAAPVTAGEEPVAKIGEGALSDAYGIAVSASGARVYVADAADGTVEVFEPAVHPETPLASLTPPEGFTSLVDSALTIDTTMEPGLPEHLLVLDDLDPGYEHPEAAVAEFEAPGSGHPASYAYVGRLRGPAGEPIVDGEPSGLAVDGAGDLLVTDGNGELGNAFEFGPAPPEESEAAVSTGGPVAPAVVATALAPSEVSATASGAAPVARPRASSHHRRRHHRHRRRHHRRHPSVKARHVR
jgi:hypothetical protein